MFAAVGFVQRRRGHGNIDLTLHGNDDCSFVVFHDRRGLDQRDEIRRRVWVDRGDVAELLCHSVNKLFTYLLTIPTIANHKIRICETLAGEHQHCVGGSVTRHVARSG